MSGIASGIISGLLVVFLAWLAKTVFLSRRLFLIQPKLFDYSDLVNAQNSKTIELTAFNGGSRSEEEVQIQLSPAFRYTIVASDAAGLTVDAQGVLRLERLAPKQGRTVILTAEGGEFRKEHVVGITSKDSVGKIKNALQEAQLTPAQNIFMVFVLFLLFPAFGYGVGKFIEVEVWPLVAPKFFPTKNVEFELEGFSINNVSATKEAAKTYRDAVSVTSVRRDGDRVTVAFRLKNPTKNRLEFTLISSSPVSEERPLGANYIVSDVLVFPDTEKEIELSDHLPPDVAPNLLSLKIVVEGPDGRADVVTDIRLGGLSSKHVQQSR